MCEFDVRVSLGVRRGEVAEANRVRGQFTRRIVKKSISDNEIWGCFAVELLLRYLGKAWSATRFYKEMGFSLRGENR